MQRYKKPMLVTALVKSLPRRPTALDALLAVAAFFGHIKSNGDPGWLVPGRGLHYHLLLEMSWRARGEK